MSDRLEFRGKLQGILELAESQEKKITLEEVETYFEEEQLSREQIDLVCDYLLSQKVAVRRWAAFLADLSRWRRRKNHVRFLRKESRDM